MGEASGDANGVVALVVGTAVLAGVDVEVDDDSTVDVAAGDAGCAGVAQPASAIAAASIRQITFALMNQ